MADWDIFHSERLEVQRGLSAAEVRAALTSGSLRDDDLARPAGTTIPWARLGDLPELTEPEPEPAPAPAIEHEQEFPLIAEDAGPPSGPDATPPTRAAALDADDEDEEFLDIRHDDLEDEEFLADDLGELDLDARLDSGSRVALPVVAARDWSGPRYDPEGEPDPEADEIDEDEEAASFTLSRNAPETVEELDLAAMVDVAFQLVLFFLVTATTVLFKSLEVPKPNPESPAQAGAQQGRANRLDDLKETYILVDVDPDGAMKIDREPVAATIPALVERLRAAREKTGRHAMLLTADYQTPHRNAVLAYDAANEIGLGIALARPAPPGKGR